MQQFSTYATPAVYTEPLGVNILEPSPEGMEKPETDRYEAQYTPFLSAFLDSRNPVTNESFLFGSNSMAFNLAFIIVACIGAFYIYIFMRTMFAK